jgi:ribosome biogenesis protein Nip4
LVEKSRQDFLAEKTLFVPELVEVESVPASLWKEIQMLPFVVDRVISFVKIGDFRQTIANETSLARKTAKRIDVENHDLFRHLVNNRGQFSPLFYY